MGFRNGAGCAGRSLFQKETGRHSSVLGVHAQRNPPETPALMYFAEGHKPAESPQEVKFDEIWTCKFYVDMNLDGRDEYFGYLHRIFWTQKSLALGLTYERIESGSIDRGSAAMLKAPLSVIANNQGTPSPFEDYTWKKVDGKVFKLWKIYDRRAAAHAVE